MKVMFPIKNQNTSYNLNGTSQKALEAVPEHKAVLL